MDTNKNDIFTMLESGTFYKGSDIKNGIKYSLFLKKFLNIHFASIIKFKKRFMDNLGGSISDEEYYKLEMDDNGNISITKKDWFNMYYSFDTKDDYIYTMKIIDEMDQVIDKIKLTSDIYDEIIYNINHNDQYSVVSLDIPRFHMLYSYLIICSFYI